MTLHAGASQDVSLFECPLTPGKKQLVLSFPLPETNIAPEKMVSQKESNLPTINFQGLC